MTGSTRLAGAWASWRAADPGDGIHSLLVHTWRPLLGAGAGLGVILALEASGSVAGMGAALQVMGFDPDRAMLITGLTVAALAAGLGALVSGRRGMPMAIAFVALADIFGTTFLTETSAALAVRGPAGFSPGGWSATLLTLVVVGLVTGWSMVTLAIEVRRWLLAGWDLTRDALAAGPRDGHSPTRRRLVRTFVPIAIVVLVVGALPTFADMINYTPDVAMTGGGFAQAPPLVGGGGSSTAAGTGPTGVSAQAATVASAPPATVAPLAVAAARPWASHPPSGQGRVVQFKLPAPWTGGRVTRTSVWLYLPPGYDAGTARYPVIYTVPWAFTNWDLGIHVKALLDQAITQGTVPPSIVAFIDLAGGPYPNSECADSFSGLEHADTYVSTSVTAYVDSHFRTIATANARTIAGFSQGGFCAANLLLRHPDGLPPGGHLRRLLRGRPRRAARLSTPGSPGDTSRH